MKPCHSSPCRAQQRRSRVPPPTPLAKNTRVERFSRRTRLFRDSDVPLLQQTRRARMLSRVNTELVFYEHEFSISGERSMVGIARRARNIVLAKRCDLENTTSDESLLCVLVKLSSCYRKKIKACVDEIKEQVDAVENKLLQQQEVAEK